MFLKIVWKSLMQPSPSLAWCWPFIQPCYICPCEVLNISALPNCYTQVWIFSGVCDYHSTLPQWTPSRETLQMMTSVTLRVFCCFFPFSSCLWFIWSQVFGQSPSLSLSRCQFTCQYFRNCSPFWESTADANAACCLCCQLEPWVFLLWSLTWIFPGKSENVCAIQYWCTDPSKATELSSFLFWYLHVSWLKPSGLCVRKSFCVVLKEVESPH